MEAPAITVLKEEEVVINNEKPVYLYIKRAIVNGECSFGQLIDVRLLEDRLKVSAIPIREALMALAAEDLIDFTPNYGFTTKQVDQQYYENQLDMLEYLLRDLAIDIARYRIIRERIQENLRNYGHKTLSTIVENSVYDGIEAFITLLNCKYRQPNANMLRVVLYSCGALLKKDSELNEGIHTLCFSALCYLRAIVKCSTDCVVLHLRQFVEERKKRTMATIRAVSALQV